MKNTNISITSDFIEAIIKLNYIFNDLSLASKSRVIKALPKSNIVIIYLDIWDAQSGKNVKTLINRCFNVGSHITTIHGANINPGIP